MGIIKSNENFVFCINGKEYAGRSMSITNKNNVIVDGVLQPGEPLVEPISVVVNGDVDHIKATSGDIVVNGDAVSIETVSGDVRCNDVGGNVSSVSGDVSADYIRGNASTVSGDIRKG